MEYLMLICTFLSVSYNNKFACCAVVVAVAAAAITADSY
jgi:hypothetical protein